MEKRNIAYKTRIGNLFHGKTIIDGERFRFVEYGERKLVRVNIVANIVEKYLSEDKKYLSLSIDDASGQIRLKIFGEEETSKFNSISQGDSVMVIGNLRSYRNELYIAPEIIKKIEPRYLLVRKLELGNEVQEKVDNTEIKAVRDKIIEMIKSSEADGGIDTEKIVMKLEADPTLINTEIQKMLEEGLAYEPRPGKIRYLG